MKLRHVTEILQRRLSIEWINKIWGDGATTPQGGCLTIHCPCASPSVLYLGCQPCLRTAIPHTKTSPQVQDLITFNQQAEIKQLKGWTVNNTHCKHPWVYLNTDYKWTKHAFIKTVNLPGQDRVDNKNLNKTACIAWLVYRSWDSQNPTLFDLYNRDIQSFKSYIVTDPSIQNNVAIFKNSRLLH